LYLTRALEDAGFTVDFRDINASTRTIRSTCKCFWISSVIGPVIGLSCMANLLPFTILAMRELRRRYPDRTLLLGGVGSKAVERNC